MTKKEAFALKRQLVAEGKDARVFKIERIFTQPIGNGRGIQTSVEFQVRINGKIVAK